jgi:hypothetical protein
MSHAQHPFPKSVIGFIRQAVTKAPEFFRYKQNAYKSLVKKIPIQKSSRQ